MAAAASVSAEADSLEAKEAAMSRVADCLEVIAAWEDEEAEAELEEDWVTDWLTDFEDLVTDWLLTTV